MRVPAYERHRHPSVWPTRRGRWRPSFEDPQSGHALFERWPARVSPSSAGDGSVRPWKTMAARTARHHRAKHCLTRAVRRWQRCKDRVACAGLPPLRHFMSDLSHAVVDESALRAVPPPDGRPLAAALAVGAVYYAGAKIGMALTFDPFPLSVLCRRTRSCSPVCCSRRLAGGGC
jgi:hypothetical protein